MKNFLINTFIFLLVLAGSLLVGWHFIQEDVILFFTQVEVVVEDFEENAIVAAETAEFDWGAVAQLDAWDWLQYVNVSDEVSPIGELLIPSIGTRLPIFLGVGEPNISIGAGTMVEGIVKGEGNYSLASHWDPNPGIRFGGLDQVQVGDVLILRDANYLYIYETIIGDNYIINNYRGDIVDEVEGEVLLTLMTCTPDGSQRIMVRGEFIEKVAIADVADMLYKLEGLEDILEEDVLEVIVEVVEILDEVSVPFPVIDVTLAVGGSIILAGFVVWISNRGSKKRER